MRVCVAAGGRFHIFDLARQLDKRGWLTRLYTGYPKWKVEGLPPDRVSSRSRWVGPTQLASRLNQPALFDSMNRKAIEDFDDWMAGNLEACDVMHSLSSFATRTQKVARQKYGALLVCERLSAHIVFQEEVLAEEFNRWKQPRREIDPVLIQRELEEYDRSDLILVPSTFAMRSFLAKGVPASKLKLAPLGVDLRTFHPVPHDDNKFRVLFVGQLGLRKGVPDLLEAVAQLRLPNLELVLIGTALPEIRPFLARYEGGYRYLGIIPRQKLFRYYSQGSVLVLPSVEEGFGMVLSQAMACGVPVISSHNTGGEDLFTEGVEGFSVPIRQPEAIAAKIRLLYDNPDLQREMSNAALERVKHLGGWDSYGVKVAGAYAEGLRIREEIAVSEPAATEATRIKRTRPLPNLRVTVSVGGKFHAFHLAEQLASRGWLDQLLTTYFSAKGNAWGLDIPRDLVVSNVLPEVVGRVPGLFFGRASHWLYHKGEVFDHWACGKLRPCDIFIGWSGFSLHTMMKARDMGATVILVRGSAHILTQKRLVDEEMFRFGQRESEVDPLTVEKELQEYELADYLAMPSHFCERSFVEQGLPKEKLRVWPLGADTRRYHLPSQPRPVEPFRVLYVGEVSPRKGIFYLVEAFQKAALPNAELTLVGDVRASSWSFLRNAPSTVKAVGSIRYPALQTYYHEASVFVLPSVEDGFGQVVMQAMATGLPVIVSTNAGASEAVTEGVNGLLFNARDVDALAECLVRLYSDTELRRSMGENAREAALRYTWANYGAVVEESLIEIDAQRQEVTAR